MNIYEVLYIAHPNLEESNLTSLIGATKQALTKRGGELRYEEIVGKKRLAYPIEKQRYGTYILLQFQGDQVDIAKFGQDLEINDDVLAQLIVSIDEEEIRTMPVVEEKTAVSESKGDDKDQSEDGVAAATADENSKEGDEKEDSPPEVNDADAEAVEEAEDDATAKTAVVETESGDSE